MKRIGDFALAILPHVPKQARILEIGCGEGNLTQALRDGGCEVIGLDSQPRAPFEIIHARFEDYDAPAQSFDCIATQLVLHHACDLDAFLDKAQRLLNADGVIAVDDYGWERSSEQVTEQWREERRDLHTSERMLAALRRRFRQLGYIDHAYFADGLGSDSLAFTFIGAQRFLPRLKAE